MDGKTCAVNIQDWEINSTLPDFLTKLKYYAKKYFDLYSDYGDQYLTIDFQEFSDLQEYNSHQIVLLTRIDESPSLGSIENDFMYLTIYEWSEKKIS